MCNKIIRSIGICVLPIIIYLAIGAILSVFISEPVVTTLIADVILAALASFYYIKFIRENMDSDNGNVKFKKDWFHLFLITMGLWLITQITVVWYYTTFGDPLLDNYNAARNGNLILYLLLTLFIAPVAEELLIRGIMFPSLKQICKPAVAAILSSVVFSMLHGTIVHMIVCMYCGLFFTLVFEYTGKLRFPIFTHILYNTFTIAFSDISLPAWFFKTPFILVCNMGVILVFAWLMEKINKI